MVISSIRDGLGLLHCPSVLVAPGDFLLKIIILLPMGYEKCYNKLQVYPFLYYVFYHYR